MRVINNAVVSLLSLSFAVLAASSWSFEDATLTVQGKGAGVGGGVKEKLSASTALSNSAIALTSTDTLKIVLTTTEDKSAKKPHQAFLTLHESTTGLEESFAFSIRESGKGKVELTQKDLPIQLLTSSKPLSASIVLGSFGSSTPLKHHTFDLTISTDASAPPPVPSAPERYTSKDEINHIFKADPRSPPVVVSAVFAAAVMSTLSILVGIWLQLGANLNHASKALGAAPVAHCLFFGSVVAMEGVFFMYYLSWNLFTTLPVAGVVGVVAFVSGSRALTEVQERRLAGER